MVAASETTYIMTRLRSRSNLSSVGEFPADKLILAGAVRDVGQLSEQQRVDLNRMTRTGQLFKVREEGSGAVVWIVNRERFGGGAS